MWSLHSRGRHRPHTEVRYYGWPLVETWETMRTAYVKPRWWQVRKGHHA